MTESEFQKLYEAAPPNMKPFLVMAVTTGMRLGEILKMKWEDIDFGNNCIYVRDTKNFEGRIIPMNSTLMQTLSVINNSSTGNCVFNYKNKKVS